MSENEKLTQIFEDINPFMGPLVPMFWTSGDVCLGFKAPHLHAFVTCAQ